MPKIIGDPPRFEYLDGQPYAKVSPKQTHARVQANLAAILLACGKMHGQIGTEWRFMPGDADGTFTEFVPDVAFVATKRLRALPAEHREKPPFSPDIAVEVRSPGDSISYLHDKIARFLRTGSLLVLDVVPKSRTIRAYSADGVRTYHPGERFENPLAPWLKFDVAEAFEGLE